MSISDVSAAESWLNEAARSLGLQDNVKIISVTNRWRWTLEFDQSPDHPDYTSNMIKLERELQTTLKRPIDLRLESQMDKNKRKQRNVLSEPRQPGS